MHPSTCRMLYDSSVHFGRNHNSQKMVLALSMKGCKVRSPILEQESCIEQAVWKGAMIFRSVKINRKYLSQESQRIRVLTSHPLPIFPDIPCQTHPEVRGDIVQGEKDKTTKFLEGQSVGHFIGNEIGNFIGSYVAYTIYSSVIYQS